MGFIGFILLAVLRIGRPSLAQRRGTPRWARRPGVHQPRLSPSGRAPEVMERAPAGAVTALPRRRRPAPCAGEIRRPLRVVRVMESGQLPGRAGRMMISGRMVDVCAELDRLVAHED